MVAGKDSARPGEGKNSWLTGTAAWNWYTITEWILGIKPQYDGLLIEPCMPAEIKKYTVRRVFRKATYNINITLTGSGKKSEFIPYSEGEHDINITL